MKEELRLLSEENVKQLLTPQDAIEAAEAAFAGIGKGSVTVGRMSLMKVDASGANNFHSMPAIVHDKEIAGLKWISTYGMPAPGYPFCHGTMVVLSDTHTGSPRAVMGAKNITAMRTAGGHGVVQAKYLANPNPRVLSVYGCGLQAQAGIRGFLTQFSTIDTVRLYCRKKEAAEAVRESYVGRAEVIWCRTPQEALEGSNLLLIATGASEYLLTPDMLKPGLTVIGIEGFRDIDPEISRMAKWYMGYKIPDEDIITDEELNPYDRLSMSDVYGDLTEVITGKIPGRESPEEIIVSTHMGMGVHDILCAHKVYERAVERGIGTTFILEADE